MPKTLRRSRSERGLIVWITVMKDLSYAGYHKMETCGGCLEMKSCEKVGAIIGNNLDARGRLENAGSI